MQRTKPPFRADHVGSFLRTAPIKEARAKRDRNEITAEQLKAVEDAEIKKIIAKQEECGLQLATDGEFRRSWWHFDFLCGLDGVVLKQIESGIQFAGVQTKAERPDIVGKIGFSGSHPMIDHFKFLAANTRVAPKMTIPSPTLLHFRFGRQSIPKTIYPDLDQMFDDLGRAYAGVVKAFYDAGCRYLQFDDTIWAFLCSEKERAQSRQRGDNPDELPVKYATMINKALAAKPADMAITTHICRGNFKSTWISEGGYEPIAEVLFGINYDGFFLEYDTERAGGFEPLRFVPKGNKQIVLGLVSSKLGALEKKGDVKKRIDEATRYVALDQLCVSPQCGFASTEEGNVLSEDEQWAKLRMIVELAKDVWN